MYDVMPQMFEAMYTVTVLCDVPNVYDSVTQLLYCVMSQMFEDIVTQHLYYVMSQMFDVSVTQLLYCVESQMLMTV